MKSVISLLDYKEFPELNLKGICIHDTGNTLVGADAVWHSVYLETSHAKERGVSWHFSVDDIQSVQHLSIKQAGTHAGSVANSTTIGIEICVNSDSDIEQAHINGALLTAKLLYITGLPISSVAQHFDYTGKNCPELMRSGIPFSWEKFIDQVQAYLSAENITNGVREITPFLEKSRSEIV